MSVTLILVEILAIGLQTLLSLSLIVINYYHINLVNLLTIKDSNLTILIPFIISASYSLGVIIDRISDTILGYLFNEILNAYGKTIKDSDHKADKLRVMYHVGSLETFLDYQRSRIRIARSTGFNALLFSIATFNLNIKSNHAYIICVISFAVSLLSGYCWFEINKKYRQRLASTISILEQEKIGRVENGL